MKQATEELVRTLSSKPVSHQRLAAAALIKTGKLEKAGELLKQVKDSQLWMWLGKAYADQGQLEPASDAYGSAVKISPQNKEAVAAQVSILHRLAVQCADKKQWDKAGNYLKKALELDSTKTSYRQLMDAVEMMSFTSGLNFSQVDSGIPVLEKLQAKDIRRADVAHQLAVFYHRKAIAGEDGKASQNGQNWEMAFGNWALVLNDLGYWKRWMESRQQAYEHNLPDDQLIKKCQEDLPDIIKKIHEQYKISYGKQDLLADVVRHKQYLARLSVELSAARNLEETRIFLQKSGRSEKLKVSCGPILWEHFKISSEVEETARAALLLDKNFAAANKVLDALLPTELIAAYISQGLVDESIGLLEKELTQNPKNQKAKDLLKKTYLDKMKTLSNEKPAEFQKILDKAKKYSLDTSELESEFAQQVVKQASILFDQEKYEEADKMLRAGLKLAGKNQTLKDKLAAVTNRRIKIMVEGSTGELRNVDQGIALMLEVDNLIGPNHPTLAENLAALYNAKGLSQTKSATTSMQLGNRYSAIESLKNARTNFEAASRLEPGNKTYRENVATVKGILNQLGIY